MKSTRSKLYPRHAELWTEFEIQQLKQLYPKYPNKWLSHELNKSVASIIQRARRLGLRKDAKQGYHRPPSRITWTAEQIAFLREHYQTMTAAEIASAIGKPLVTVQRKANYLGLKKTKLWMPEKEQQFRELYSNNSLSKLAKKFGRSTGAIRAYAKKIGIPRRNFFWSEKETEYLRRNYHRMTAAELAAKLNRPEVSISRKGRQFGLKSSKKWWWTEKETQYLKRWYHKKTFKELTEALGKSRSAVARHAKLLGFSKTKRWTKKEFNQLIRLCSKGVTLTEIARCLSRTPISVYLKLYPPERKKVY